MKDGDFFIFDFGLAIFDWGHHTSSSTIALRRGGLTKYKSNKQIKNHQSKIKNPPA
jgi:hypothetical protein